MKKCKDMIMPTYIDKDWYEINGVPCQYEKEGDMFFWESKDGTKYFFASSIKEYNLTVKHISK